MEYLTKALAGLVDVDVHAFGGEGATVHEPDPGLAGANAALQTLSVDLRMARRRRLRRPAQPHLVRRHGRPPRIAAPRRAARRHHALPGAAPALEGRAARRRLRPLLLVGEGGPARRRGGHRGLQRDGRVGPRRLPVPRPRARPRRPQRHRHRRVPARRAHRCRRAPGPRPRRPLRDLRRAHHPAEGRRGAPALRRLLAGPAARLRLLPRHPRDQGVRRRPHDGAPGQARRRRLGLGDAAPRRPDRVPRRRDRLRLPLHLRAARHRQPRGHGLRHRCRRLPCRRHPEVVDHGTSGLLVDLGDGYESRLAEAVVGLLEDPARAAAMGTAGRARAVADFGWDAIARRTVEVYRSVL